MKKFQRREFILLTGGISTLLSSCSPVIVRADKKKLTNLLFIITDQQRWDAISYAGNKILKTPHLDRLAREGAFFKNAFSQCPVCSPARTSILTGCSIEKTGVRTNPGAYRTRTPDLCPMQTFDEILSDKEYSCEFYGKWHSPVFRALIYKNPAHSPVTAAGMDQTEVGPGMGKYINAYLDKYVPKRKIKQSELYDVYCNRPYEPDPYYNMYPADKMIPPKSIHDSMENSPYIKTNGRQRLKEYQDKEKIKFMISNYYGLITEIDDWIGEILNKLTEIGKADNTLVIFTSDHGEMLGAHGMREKNVFYEESIHIPLIMRLPGIIKPGTIVEEPVSQINLFATILDYLNAGRYSSDGKSMKELIEGRNKKEWEFAVSEWNWRGDKEPNFMVRTKKWKYLCAHSKKSKIINVLYNLEDDPYEMNNLIGNNPNAKKYKKQAEEMKKKLVSRLKSVNSPHLKDVK